MKTYKSGSEKTLQGQDFPGGPVVKKVPCHAGNAGSIPGQRTLIPHAEGLLSPCTTSNEVHAPYSTHGLQQDKWAQWEAPGCNWRVPAPPPPRPQWPQKLSLGLIFVVLDSAGNLCPAFKQTVEHPGVFSSSQLCSSQMNSARVACLGEEASCGSLQ